MAKILQAGSQFLGGRRQSSIAATSIAPIAAGAWSWYTNPRAVYANGYTYATGVVGTKTYLYQYSRPGSVVSFDLDTLSPSDDHNNAAILLRADGKIMSFVAQHDGAEIYQRISGTAGSVATMGTETGLDATLGHSEYSYPCPVQLTGETNSPIYLFYRSYTLAYRGVWVTKSTDGGATWGSPVKVFANGTDRPYMQVIANGNNRIDFAVTDGHPVEVATNSIYHCYYTNGNLYKSDGTLIGALDAGPYTPATHLTRVYNGATYRSWIWDIATDGSGYPAIAYVNFVTTSDHRYRYARWTGSAWTDNEVCAGGTGLYAEEVYYSGGVTIDKRNPLTVYVSKQVSSQWEIWRYTSADGATWTGAAITAASAKPHIRPTSPIAAVSPVDVLWCYGTYNAYTNFSMIIQALQRFTVAADWWLAGAKIPAANVLEHIEFPTVGQLYAGGAAAGAWTVAIRTTYDGTGSSHLFDSEGGRFIAAWSGNSERGFYSGAWTNLDLFTVNTNAVYFFVSTGSSIQAYRDNVAIGAPVSSNVDIASTGATRWRSRFSDSATSPWLYPVELGMVANIALDSTQRAALLTSMQGAL